MSRDVRDGEEASWYLDVNIGSAAAWYSDAGAYRAFRLIGFQERYAAWAKTVDPNRQPRTEFNVELRGAVTNLNIGANTPWIATSLAAAQMDALEVDGPLLFDKALLALVTMNRLVAAAAAQSDLAKLGPLGDHCIVCCAFRFPELSRYIALAIDDLKGHSARLDHLNKKIDEFNNNRQATKADNLRRVRDQISALPDHAAARQWLVEYIEFRTRQQRRVLRLLTGEEKALSTSGKEVMATASYRTLRAIYKVLRRFPSVDNQIGTTPRKDIIPLRRKGSPNFAAADAERVVAGPIHRSTYGWPDAGVPEDQRRPRPINMPDHPFGPPPGDPDDFYDDPTVTKIFREPGAVVDDDI